MFLFGWMKNELNRINVSDEEIVAIADGEIIELEEVNDPIFSKKILGYGVAFKFNTDEITICSPANGTLSMLFPTNHSFGVTMNNGIELLIHIGINTVELNGYGFKILNKKQGDNVRAGEPIISVNLKKLIKKYDMTTMLIVSDSKEHKLNFISNTKIKKGNSIIKK